MLSNDIYFLCQPCEKTVSERGDGIDNDCDGRIDEEICDGENALSGR